MPEIRFYERQAARIDKLEVARGASATLTLKGTVQVTDSDYERLSRHHYLVDDKGIIYRREGSSRVLLDTDLGKVTLPLPKPRKERAPRPPTSSLIPEHRVKKDPRELNGPKPVRVPKARTPKLPRVSTPLFQLVATSEPNYGNYRHPPRVVTRFNVPNKSSKFKNVSLMTKQGIWNAVVNKDHVKYRVGAFATELEAAIAADTKSRELFGKYAITNESLGLLPQGWEQIVLKPIAKRRDFKSGPTSHYKGVSLDRSCKSRPWRARLCIPGQKKAWESWYETQEKAAAEFDAMALRTHGPKYKTNKAMGLL